jgi:hypothetical protein
MPGKLHPGVRDAQLDHALAELPVELARVVERPHRVAHERAPRAQLVAPPPRPASRG